MGQSDIGNTDAALVKSALGLGLFNLVLAYACYRVLKSGWKLKD